MIFFEWASQLTVGFLRWSLTSLGNFSKSYRESSLCHYPPTAMCLWSHRINEAGEGWGDSCEFLLLLRCCVTGVLLTSTPYQTDSELAFTTMIWLRECTTIYSYDSLLCMAYTPLPLLSHPPPPHPQLLSLLHSFT